MKSLAKFGLMAVLAAATAVLALATTGPADAIGQDKTPEKKADAAGASKGLRVYWATHSMLWYAPDPFGVLAKAAGFSDYKMVGHTKIGASRVEQHWQQAAPKDALKTGNVDVFVMAPIGFPDKGIENFVKLGLEHNPNMRFTAQISWGCYDLDMNLFPGSMKSSKGAVDRNKTPEQLKKINEDNIKTAEAQADEINKNYGKGKKVLFLVPSAQSNVALRIKIHDKKIPGLDTQGELFRDAISHPGPAQEALNTYLYFAMIYGKSPVGLPRTSLLTKKYDDKVNTVLQELAWETAISYPYSGVTGKLGETTSVPAQPEKPKK